MLAAMQPDPAARDEVAADLQRLAGDAAEVGAQLAELSTALSACAARLREPAPAEPTPPAGSGGATP